VRKKQKGINTFRKNLQYQFAGKCDFLGRFFEKR
jgi:hypothetical protein